MEQLTQSPTYTKWLLDLWLLRPETNHGFGIRVRETVFGQRFLHGLLSVIRNPDSDKFENLWNSRVSSTVLIFFQTLDSYLVPISSILLKFSKFRQRLSSKTKLRAETSNPKKRKTEIITYHNYQR